MIDGDESSDDEYEPLSKRILRLRRNNKQDNSTEEEYETSPLLSPLEAPKPTNPYSNALPRAVVQSGYKTFKPFLTKSSLWSHVTLDLSNPPAFYLGPINVSGKAATNLVSPRSFGLSYYKRDPLLNVSNRQWWFALNSSNASYVGGWKDGYFEESGTLFMRHPKWKHVSIQGNFREGRMMGTGTFTWTLTGNTLQTEWSDLMPKKKNMRIMQYPSTKELVPILIKGALRHVGLFRCNDPTNVTELVAYSTWEQQSGVHKRPHQLIVHFDDDDKTGPFKLKTEMCRAMDAWNEYQKFMESNNDKWPFELKFLVSDTYHMLFLPLRCSPFERSLFQQGSDLLLYEIERTHVESMQAFLNASDPTLFNYGADTRFHSDYNEFLILDMVGVHNPTLEEEWYYQSFQRKSSDETRQLLRQLLAQQRAQHNDDPSRPRNDIRFSLQSQTRFSKFVAKYPNAVPDQTRSRNQARYNPQYLFHGAANPLAIQHIMQSGFKWMNRTGQFGSGLYMADEFAKSDQYMTIDRLNGTSDATKEAVRTGKEALLKLIDYYQTNLDFRDVEAVANELGTSNACKREQVYVMMIVKANMGNCLHIVANEEFNFNKINVAPTDLSGDYERFKGYAIGLDKNDNPFIPSSTTHTSTEMKNMSRLNKDFDSVMVQDWGHNVGYYGTNSNNGQLNEKHKLRYPEFVLYGDDCKNALPVALVFYVRRKNPSKPCVKGGQGSTDAPKMSIPPSSVPTYTRDTSFDQDRYYLPEIPPE